MGTNVILNQKKQFLPFKEAREFARSLGLKGQIEWNAYCKSGNKPDDITSSPYLIYKNQGWKGYGDWLGTGSVASFNKKFLSYDEAKAFVQKLEFTNRDEWTEFCKLKNNPDNIPAKCDQVYKNKGWTSWGDFLGTGTVAPRYIQFRPFAEAREFVRGLGLKTTEEWRAYCKSGNKPDDIPAAPWQVYKEWKKK